MVCSHRPGMIHTLPVLAPRHMAVPFMRSDAQSLVRACHTHGAHAIGGMSAFIPNRREPEVTENALVNVREDKQREADAGFDGTWVAHPDLGPPVLELFAAKEGLLAMSATAEFGAVATSCTWRGISLYCSFHISGPL